MGNDAVAAQLLATEVHRDVQLSDVPNMLEIPTDFEINVDDLGIWIDPIGKYTGYDGNNNLRLQHIQLIFSKFKLIQGKTRKKYKSWTVLW